MIVGIDTSSINFGHGKYIGMCSSDYSFTEYFKLPYKTKYSKGAIFICASGYITATSDEIDHRYAYGDDIDDEDEKSLIPLIEKYVGMKYKEITEKCQSIERAKYNEFVRSCME